MLNVESPMLNVESTMLYVENTMLNVESQMFNIQSPMLKVTVHKYKHFKLNSRIFLFNLQTNTQWHPTTTSVELSSNDGITICMCFAIFHLSIVY